MLKILFLLWNVLIIDAAYSQKIMLLKQWHLPPKVETLNIDIAKNLSQYKNQKALYEKVYNLVTEGKVQILLSEGCEKIEIDQSFSPKFNGWDYQKLSMKISEKNYGDILTLLPLKVEVFFKEKIKTLCIDDLHLIDQSQLALSDVRAYIGYSARLDYFKQKKDMESYNRYAASLLSEEEKKQKVDALIIAKKKARQSLDLFVKINTQREEKIIENILKLKLNEKDMVAIVIGGIHVEELNQQLKKRNFLTEVYTPEGYVDNDKGLVEELRGILK